MRKVYAKDGVIMGDELAHGTGVKDMLDISFNNGWSEDNTILVVDDTDDLDSKWTIYKLEQQ